MQVKTLDRHAVKFSTDEHALHAVMLIHQLLDADEMRGRLESL